MQKPRVKSSISKKKSNSLPVFSIAICVMAGLLATVILTLLFGILLCMLNLPFVTTDALVLVSLGVGGLVCGKVTARAFPKERGSMALICALSGTILLVLVNLLWLREPITLLSFVKYTIIVSGSLIGAMITPSQSRRRVYKKN